LPAEACARVSVAIRVCSASSRDSQGDADRNSQTRGIQSGDEPVAVEQGVDANA
jgi:hypothetical protein